MTGNDADTRKIRRGDTLSAPAESTPLLQHQTRADAVDYPDNEPPRSFARRLLNLWRASDDELETDGIDASALVRNRSRLSSQHSIPEHIADLKTRQRRKRSAENGAGALAGAVIEDSVGDSLAGAGAVVDPDALDEDTHVKPGSQYKIGAVRFWLVIANIMLGNLLGAFDITLMASSHPVITSYFNASRSASWLTTVFLITSTSFQPFWARLSDTIGRRSVYTLLLLIFTLTNLWCALSTTIGSFIAARAVCGLGAGGAVSMGLVIINDLIYVEYRGVFLSHCNLVFGIGTASGAAFGGLICDYLGWRWAFGMQVPVLAVCCAAAMLTVPRGLGPMLIECEGEDDEKPAWTAIKRFDWAGIMTLVFTTTSLILFLNLGGNIFPWNHWIVILSLVLSIVGCPLFILIESRAKQPVMPLHFLYKAPIVHLVLANLLAAAASNAVLFNAPLYFQAVQLTTPTKSGLLLAAPAIFGSSAGVSTGYIITYTRRLKPTLLLGAISYVIGGIALCCISRDTSIAVACVFITIVLIGQGLTFPSSMMSAFSVSTEAEQAVVTTTVLLWRNLGIVSGIAVSSLVLQNNLVVQLNRFVHGRTKDQVIARVRSSVRSIHDLHEPYREQAIQAYALALRITFVVTLGSALLLLVVVLFCKLPRLRRSSKQPMHAGE